MLRLIKGGYVYLTTTLLAPRLLLAAADMPYYRTWLVEQVACPTPTLYKMSACFIKAKRQPENDS